MNKTNRMITLWWLLAAALVAAGLALLVLTEPMAQAVAWIVAGAAVLAYGILQAGDRSTRMQVGAVPKDPEQTGTRREQRTDQELQDSFPASDAPSWTLGRDKKATTRKNVGANS